MTLQYVLKPDALVRHRGRTRRPLSMLKYVCLPSHLLPPVLGHQIREAEHRAHDKNGLESEQRDGRGSVCRWG